MHPILFKIPLPHWKLPAFFGGGELHAFPIYAYGVMLGLSLVVGWYISLGIAKADGLPRETMANNYVFTAICAIIGSRVLYILTNLSEFEDPQTHRMSIKALLAIRSGGLVAYGGFLGGFLGSWYFCARRKIKLTAWADAAVPSLASGLLFTRIGCYLFGCDFGKKLPEKAPGWLKKLGTFPEWHYDHKTSQFLDSEGLRKVYAAATEPSNKPQILSGSPAWVQHTESDPIVRDLHHSLPVHPTQIYESLCGLLLLGILFWARQSIKKREAAGEPFFRGELFLVFTFGYGVLRFLLEIVRDDAERGTYGMFMDPHIAYPGALMLMALGFWFGLSHIVVEKYRVYAQAAAVLVPFVVFMLLRPSNKFELVEKIQFSTSQWIAVLTGVAAALYYRRGLDLAVADPVAAADLGEGVPALLEAEAAAERGETPGAADDDKDEEDEEDAEDEKVGAKDKASEKKLDEKKLDEKVAAKKAEEKKPEAKKLEEKKPEEKKADEKKADEKKVEAKKDEPKVEAKKDEPKVEAKKDEPKSEAKSPDVKKDAPAVEKKDEKADALPAEKAAEKAVEAKKSDEDKVETDKPASP